MMRGTLLLVTFLACFCAPALADAADRPPYTEYAKMARWLVHANTWGVLASISPDNKPLSGVMSYSDGPQQQSTGRILFYMTPMDETTQNIMGDPRASFTITEAQLHPEGCHATDPEDPTCAKLSVLGQVKPVPSEARGEAMEFMVARHPAMAHWPADHGFTLYELHIEELHLLDWYGGMHLIPPRDYFAAEAGAVGRAAAPVAQAAHEHGASAQLAGQLPQQQQQQRPGGGRTVLRGAAVAAAM